MAELRQLLVDFAWLQTKLTATTPPVVVSDFNYVTGENSQGYRTIQNVIQKCQHVTVADGKQLASQLTGRLVPMENDAVDLLLASVKNWHSWAWLRPLAPSLPTTQSFLERTFAGHTQAVYAVAVVPSDDGECVLSVSDDRTLKIWHFATGTLLRTCVGHRESVSSLAVTPDGRFVLTGSKDGTVRLWRIDNDVVLRVIETGCLGVKSVAITSDARLAFSGSGIHQEGHKDEPIIKVWDLASGNEVMQLRGHTDNINALCLNEKANELISVSGDGYIIAWDLTTGTEIYRVGERNRRVFDVALLPNGLPLSAHEDGTVRTWDVEARTEASRWNILGYPVTAIISTQDANIGAAGSQFGEVVVWWGPDDPTFGFTAHKECVQSFAFAGDASYLITGSEDGAVKVWDLKRCGRDEIVHHTDIVNTILIEPRGRLAFTGAGSRNIIVDSTIKIWDLTTGSEVGILQGHERGVHSLSLSDDGRQLVSMDYTGSRRVWDVENLAELEETTDKRYQEPRLHIPEPASWQFVVNASEGVLLEPTGIPPPNGALPTLQLQPDRLNISWDFTLTGQARHIAATLVTPDLRYAMAGSEDGDISVWDLSEQAEPVTWKQSGSRINSLSSTPCGQTLAVASRDGVLNVWNVASQSVIANFIGESAMTACAITADGNTIVAGEESGRVHILRLEPDERDL